MNIVKTGLLVNDLSVPQFSFNMLSGHKYKIYLYDWQRKLITSSYIEQDTFTINNVDAIYFKIKDETDNIVSDNNYIYFFGTESNVIYPPPTPYINGILGKSPVYTIDMQEAVIRYVIDGKIYYKTVGKEFVPEHTFTVAYPVSGFSEPAAAIFTIIAFLKLILFMLSYLGYEYMFIFVPLAIIMIIFFVVYGIYV